MGVVVDTRRVAYIDGLRAVAILLVVFCHAADHAGVNIRSNLGLAALSGSHGVDLFFVISGFCLAHPTLARLHAEGSANFDVLRFAAHRLVRIIPPYYVAISSLIALGVTLRFLGFHAPQSMSQNITAIDVLKHATFSANNQTPTPNGSFWTLPIEFRWYFLFPLCMWLWVGAPRVFMAIVIWIMLASRELDMQILSLPAFMLGIVAADFRIRKKRFIALGLITTVVCILWGFAVSPSIWTNYAHPAWQIAAFAFVLLAGSSRLLMSVLSLNWLTAVGTASYGIYLIHEPVIALMEEHHFAWFLAVPIALGSGFAFWWLVERHFVSGAARNRILITLELRLQHVFEVVGVAKRMRLNIRSVPAASSSGEAITNMERSAVTAGSVLI